MRRDNPNETVENVLGCLLLFGIPVFCVLVGILSLDSRRKAKTSLIVRRLNMEHVGMPVRPEFFLAGPEVLSVYPLLFDLSICRFFQ